jgi:hypothetical protein
MLESARQVARGGAAEPCALNVREVESNFPRPLSGKQWGGSLARRNGGGGDDAGRVRHDCFHAD